jgi:hypothetical protein
VTPSPTGAAACAYISAKVVGTGVIQENIMKANVGELDRVLRIVVGAALIASAVSGYFTPWGYIGLVPLATGLVRFCPAYRLLGLRTCPIEKHGI